MNLDPARDDTNQGRSVGETASALAVIFEHVLLKF
jgi:hypothetical protein